ncbi:hypothetical protein ES705_43987 [subsurface metagenome]
MVASEANIATTVGGPRSFFGCFILNSNPIHVFRTINPIMPNTGENKYSTLPINSGNPLYPKSTVSLFIFLILSRNLLYSHGYITLKGSDFNNHTKGYAKSPCSSIPGPVSSSYQLVSPNAPNSFCRGLMRATLPEDLSTSRDFKASGLVSSIRPGRAKRSKAAGLFIFVR